MIRLLRGRDVGNLHSLEGVVMDGLLPSARENHVTLSSFKFLRSAGDQVQISRQPD
jgi:hypothetical protein